MPIPATPPKNPLPALIIAAITLLVFMGLLFLMIWRIDILEKAGLLGQFWYILSLLLGLFAAILVFSLFKSYAHYKGKVFGGVLELGGPVVVMFATIVLGFYLAPPPVSSFNLTIFVHEKSSQAQVLKSEGKITLHLANNPQTEPIDEKGTARFSNIPPNMRGTEVAVALEGSNRYELVNPNDKLKLDKDVLYLSAHLKSKFLLGNIKNESQQPVADAEVRVKDTRDGTTHRAKSDTNGDFKLPLPADLPLESRRLAISAKGCDAQELEFVLDSGNLAVGLKNCK